jgi:hypothetical protein
MTRLEFESSHSRGARSLVHLFSSASARYCAASRAVSPLRKLERASQAELKTHSLTKAKEWKSCLPRQTHS